jgi:hypothetical protein
MAANKTTGYLVELEDNGQDFLTFTTDAIGTITKTEPFQGGAWNGGYIPIESQQEGELCMMHNPPNINYGYLKHRVKKITAITDESN